MADVDIGIIYDSVGLDEDVELQLDRSIEINESVGLDEDIKLSLVNNISVYDSIAVIDVETFLTTSFFGTPVPLKVPAVLCIAHFRENITVDSKVPIVSGVGFFGTAVIGKAPTPSAVITMRGAYAGYISVAGIAPTPEGIGRFGGTVKGKVPTASCEAVLANRGMSVSGYAPIATAELELYNNGISVNGYAPFPTVQAALTADGYITITGKAPVVIGNIIVSEAGLIVITGIAPVVKVEYGGIQTGGNTITVTGTAPVVTTYQPTGDTDPGSITISEHERFDDITLQYRRWENAV